MKLLKEIVKGGVICPSCRSVLENTHQDKITCQFCNWVINKENTEVIE